MSPRFLIIALTALTACAACQSPLCSEMVLEPSSANTCRLPNWPGRDFDLHLPAQPLGAPLLIVFHGGGGNKKSTLKLTCPEGDEDNAECLDAMALERGYIVAVPNGTKSLVGNLRTWNAGGGVDEFRCTAGKACEENVDDIAYTDDLIEEIAQVTAFDRERVYLTGISNGAAMSYRLACERANAIAAIAPVGGGNQSIVAPGCSPERAVPLIHFHGTGDPAWKYEGGEPDAPIGQEGKVHVSIEETVMGGGEFSSWKDMSNCVGEAEITMLEDRVSDGTQTEVLRYANCDAPVTLVRTLEGGHTWPRGWLYGKEETIGLVAQDFSANEMILDFIDDKRSPTD